MMEQLLQKIFKFSVEKIMTAVDWWTVKKSSFSLEDSSKILLNYGKRIPISSRAYGGCVKLLHLNNVYPENDNQFNIFYLVSSCLPLSVGTWIKSVKKQKIKVVWNQNGVAYPAWAGKYTNSINRTLRNNLHKSDYVVYQSWFCKEGADTFLGKFAGDFEIVYNSVDTNKFKPIDNKNLGETIVLLIMGSHSNRERVTLPLELVKMIKDKGLSVKLIIAGRLLWDGALSEVKEIIKKMDIGDNVEILGQYSQDMAPSIYNRAGILLHLMYNDACPTVPIEAMACGVPVVGLDCGGMPELIGKEGGSLISVPHSYEKMYKPELVDVYRAVKSINKKQRQFSISARERAVTMFDNSIWLDKHRLIFERLLKSDK
ncbi:MAG: glycosyltransferase family 4 protein [Candidatus Shapirobacteria bacterium]